MNALKNYVVMIVTCTLIMGICSSAYAKDHQSKGNVSTTAVNGSDGNKKDDKPDKVKEISSNKKNIVSDRSQGDLPLKAGNTTPAGQIQTTVQGSMQGLKQVEELSCLRQEIQEIGSKQDELRTDVQRFARVITTKDGRGMVPILVGVIAVILILMGILGYFILRGHLEGHIDEKLGGIKTNSNDTSFSVEQIEEIKQAILAALPSSSGKLTSSFVSLSTGQIDTIADRVYNKLGLSNELKKLAELHFGPKMKDLGESVKKIENFTNSVDSLNQTTQKITASAWSLSEKVGEAIRSLDEAKTGFVMGVRTAKESFCNDEAVKVLPDVQSLIKELSGTLKDANEKLGKEVENLRGEYENAQGTIAEKDAEITRLNDAIQMKGSELNAEQAAHRDDNASNKEVIDQLSARINDLQTKLGVAEAAKDAAQQSFENEQSRRGVVEVEKGNLEKIIASRDVWNKSLFPSWFEDETLKTLHDALCSEFVDKAPSTECLFIRAALLELKAMESRGVSDGIESLLTRLGRYCFAYLGERGCEIKDVFEFGRRIAMLVSESDMVRPTGVYVRVPRMGGQVDPQWMRSSSNERVVQAIRTWSVWTKNGLSSKAEVN